MFFFFVIINLLYRQRQSEFTRNVSLDAEEEAEVVKPPKSEPATPPPATPEESPPRKVSTTKAFLNTGSQSRILRPISLRSAQNSFSEVMTNLRNPKKSQRLQH